MWVKEKGVGDGKGMWVGEKDVGDGKGVGKKGGEGVGW